MNKSKTFTKYEEGGTARLVDLCAADRARVAALVDELGRHAERTSIAEARIVRLNEQLQSQARDTEVSRKQAEDKLVRETAELKKLVESTGQGLADAQAQLDSKTREADELRMQLEAESKASAENAKQAEQKYAELRRNATKVAELNRELESRLAALEARAVAQCHSTTQTEPVNQLVAATPRFVPPSPRRDRAILSELFFMTPPSPPELEDLFFLPSGGADDCHALFDP